MGKPLESDFINAHLITNRILMRKMFETLRDKPTSKYFKNIVIKDVDWSVKTFSNNNIPLNFPQKILDKYPYDFEISFTSLGCNMLKCYNNNNNNNNNNNKNINQPMLINNYILGGGEACLAIYKEFNNYLKEKFFLPYIKENDNNEKSIPFETFSIYDEKKDKNYCGIQLTSLKTFSILPSSRWNNGEESAKEYLEKYKDSTPPLRLRELAGLIDAPPLTWDIKKQNAQFNYSYCRRFNKQYNRLEDYCYHSFVRKGANYVFGENFINNTFPSLDNMLINKTLPFEYLNDLIWNNGLKIDDGYSEKVISQTEFEKRLHIAEPDIKLRNTNVINNSSSTIYSKRKNLATQTSNLFAEIVSQIAQDSAIEMSLTTLPSVSARLLKYYSSKFLHRLSTMRNLPASIQLFSLTARIVINEIALKWQLKC